jgi:hypothetical protein
MNIQFVCYFTEREVSDLKSILKDKTLSVNFSEQPVGDSKLIRALVFVNSDYDFQQFINACIRLGANMASPVNLNL